ncbi:DUF423 domain-containing protein [Reichenbachiella carrageenanivorans]|uniref:DUF423 domain-containing protein n=1 Tax=Reichenbachiella carrageenanivorans TaxID=2979869 RepID=A0ABY6CYR7_9BACT|nr:DUF423 domain-containing protein [Reichenbachiella carrageenanivorans]UXX79056.1 DUF423 domain-containing protein [Reichenbachiella carrageenanivorans]
MNKKALVLGAVFGLLTVMIGAFGAHALKDLLEENGRLEVFETGVRYQFYHAIALLVCGLLDEKLVGSWVAKATYLFSIGVLVFSGSLYILSITNVAIFGAITPIGGLMLMGGWLCLIAGIVKSKV